MTISLWRQEATVGISVGRGTASVSSGSAARSLASAEIGLNGAAACAEGTGFG